LSFLPVERWNRRDQKLLEAVQRGDVGRVAALASRKSARPTKLNSNGQSPFHLAASKGLTECLTILLANGADINSKNEDGSTALHLATISCQPQCVKVLLQHGANEDAVDAENRSPLHWAASSGCASSVLLLCDHEAFLDVLDSDGRTPLMIASLGGHAAICSQLLQRGARVNVTDKDNKSALILACEKGSAEVAELLLSHGADAGAVDSLGHDALHYALRTQDNVLWELLHRALNRRRRGGKIFCPFKQGCPLNLLARHIQELKQQQGAVRVTPNTAPSRAEASAPAEVPREAHGPPQSPRSEDIRKATGEQATATHGGQTPSTEAEPVGAAGMHQLLLQLREELAAVWREKDAAKGALSRPVLEGALGTPRAEAAAAAWEKMEARLERVLVRLDRAKAGLQAKPESPSHGESRAGAPRAGPGCAREREEKKRAAGARGEPLGAPGEQAPGGCPAKGPLEKGVSALRLNNSNLLEELGELGRQRQLLQGELQALNQRLQREFMPKPGEQDQLQQLQRSVGLLTLELATEKNATEKLRRRLAFQSSGLRGLWDCLPPDLVGHGKAPSADEPLDELRACISTLVDGHREAQQALAGLRKENEQLRASVPSCACGEPRDAPSAGASSTAPQVAALEHDLGQLEEELRAVQATMSGKSQEIAKLRQLLYQATEEVAELRSREAASLRQQEKARGSLAAQAQAWGQELQVVLDKYNSACREASRLREALAEQERLADEARARCRRFENCTELLRERTEHLAGACRDKEGKIKELLKKLEQLSEEVLAVQGENAHLTLKLQDSQKNHEDIISTYRNHLLNAARGYMEQDVYNILLRILSMKE
uniref:Ankyrin repeat domain 35 n=1 Tax=Jaculus jaculus TaxID=51337 RepID=A0A8C5JWJ5_JACJA